MDADKCSAFTMHISVWAPPCQCSQQPSEELPSPSALTDEEEQAQNIQTQNWISNSGLCKAGSEFLITMFKCGETAGLLLLSCYFFQLSETSMSTPKKSAQYSLPLIKLAHVNTIDTSREICFLTINMCEAFSVQLC